MNIEFQQAGMTFEGRIALHPLSLSLVERRIGIIGLNGSGKTTFARMINGLNLPTTGRVLVGGRDTAKDTQAVMADTGFVFQSPQNQIILPIVMDDIELGLKARGYSKSERTVRAENALARLGIAHLARRRAHELSGGELQLAALAAVLAPEPSTVILDEPTNQLDLKNRKRVIATIEGLEEDIIIISHDLAMMRMMERVLLFSDGRIMADGQPETVISHYEAMNA